MFTDRFVKVPIKIYSQVEENLLGKGKVTYFDSHMKILPFDIASYKPTTDDSDIDCLYVTLKNGYGFLVYLTEDEFESLLNSKIKE